jgi:hypothetical protein
MLPGASWRHHEVKVEPYTWRGRIVEVPYESKAGSRVNSKERDRFKNDGASSKEESLSPQKEGASPRKESLSKKTTEWGIVVAEDSETDMLTVKIESDDYFAVGNEAEEESLIADGSATPNSKNSNESPTISPHKSLNQSSLNNSLNNSAIDSADSSPSASCRASIGSSSPNARKDIGGLSMSLGGTGALETNTRQIHKSKIVKSTFCAIGVPVKTTYGIGVLSSYRIEDDIHNVTFPSWNSMGHLNRNALIEPLTVCPGVPATTSCGVGIVGRQHKEFATWTVKLFT